MAESTSTGKWTNHGSVEQTTRLLMEVPNLKVWITLEGPDAAKYGVVFAGFRITEDQPFKRITESVKATAFSFQFPSDLKEWATPPEKKDEAPPSSAQDQPTPETKGP